MQLSINSLACYPIKGLSRQELKNVLLETGQGFPGDRCFGFARPNSGFDADDPKPLPKTKFYMLARDSLLALLKTEYDNETNRLTLTTPSSSQQFDIQSAKGKTEASLFLKSFLQLPDDETPQLYEASPHRFTDVSVVSAEMMNAISIINTDTVQAFSDDIETYVDPKRFRGNIHISGLEPFAELDWVGKRISIGDVQLKIVQRTKRCPATEVDLDTGTRDIKTPKLLLKHYGHMDMGVYGEVINGGTISNGDIVRVD